MKIPWEAIQNGAYCIYAHVALGLLSEQLRKHIVDISFGN